MKIEKLHIYGFGKHENVQIDLKSGMNVFYGENEAGKSTIQQFILHILFGFPQKNAQLLRYEPKSGAAYGGKVQLIDEKMGRVVIERVKGKASGDVTLYFEDGTRGGEKELDSLLHSYNRVDFEAIFSFSLLQLQGFDKMTEEELTRTLLSSGTTGMDTLSNVEAQFVKEMGELFKPSGKKPIINQKIEELREMEEEWKSHLAEVDKYEPSTKRLNEVEILLEQTNLQEKKVMSEIHRFMQWKQLKPIKEKQINILAALEKIQHQSFPSDGIRRFESIKDKEMNVKAATEQLSENLEKLSNSNALLTIDQLNSLQTFLANETEWHQLKAKKVQIEEEQTKTLQNQMQQLALVGIDWEKNLNDIVRADISIHQEEKLVTLLKKREQLESELLQENRLYQLKSEDLRLHQGRLKEIKHTKSSSSGKIPVVFSSIIFLLGLILIFLQSNWLIGLTFLIVSVLVYVGFSFVLKTSHQSNDIRTYESLLAKELQALATQIGQLENTIHALELEQKEVERDIQSFLRNYHLNNQVSPNLLKELFSRLRMIQEQQIQLDQMDINLHEVRKKMQGFLKQGKNMVNIPLIEDMLFHQLREYFLSEKKKVDENESIHQKIKEITLKQKENISLLQAYAQNIQELFQEAKVESESDFYAAFQFFEKRLSLEKELHQIQIQLGNKEMALDDFDEAFESESKEQLHAIQKSRNELVEEKASLQYQTSKLLVEDQQSEILQKIEQKKAELHEYVKKWVAFKTVVEAIKQMMVQLKEERLPEVLEKAQVYFRMLTRAAYEQLVLTPEGIFEAIKASGQRFKIDELSQATKEQAYISLRIALAQSLKNKAPFPIIMDDPFVHFDRFRLQQVVQLMQELQKEEQLLYFSCHDNMQYVWEDAHIVQVATY
ncbi:ATP-binding protein [Psychrobacillus sp. L3]|uniref:ATP-binding protein n=1 Tax=Psychrobacillus sp. L3 TaxID=3236891 RepID=UPI0036F2F9E7